MPFSRFLGDATIETITADQISKYLMRIPNRATRQRPTCRNQALLPLSGTHPPPRQSDPQNAAAEGTAAPSVLSEKEVEQLIGAQRPKDDDQAGWRDRSLIETLFVRPARWRGGCAQLFGHPCGNGDGPDPPRQGRQVPPGPDRRGCARRARSLPPSDSKQGLTKQYESIFNYAT